jgi:hypothetical protein
MKFEAFNKKYRDGKKGEVWKMCLEGLTIMKNSPDPVHDIRHVENIFGHLDKIVRRSKFKKINFDILMLSVCWHDCWKASKDHGGWLSLFYRQAVEGVAAAKKFNRNAKKYNLPQNTLKGVFYSIRKHSQINFLPINTV